MGGRKTIALILALSLLASGCGSGAGEQRDEEKITAQKLAQSVREKYADEEAYEYEEAIQDIGRDQHLKLQMGFDIMDAGFDEYTQIAAVYQDPGLTQRVGTHYEWDEESQVMEITPPKWSAGGISSSQLDPDVPGNEPGALELFDKGELKDWGNLPQYYLAEYVDRETGEKLQKPRVTVVTVKHEVSQAPRVTVSLDEDGLPVFSWQKIKDADRYILWSLITIRSRDTQAQAGCWERPIRPAGNRSRLRICGHFPYQRRSGRKIITLNNMERGQTPSTGKRLMRHTTV